MRLLHQTNPYEGFDLRCYAPDLHGWGSRSPAFRELIAQTKPRLIVEVGTWKGASALEMAAVTRELGLSTQILCIDTWLGALEFWTDQSDPERYLSLQLRHGYPSVFYQFLANVCHQGFQDRIIPFPQTASIAALWLRYYGITAEMIYLDASHEEEDVYQDLCNFWNVVRPHGILFGDDYSWDGVRLAVNRFANEQGRQISFIADKWILRKEG
jgi:methyltransferase family protein